MADLIDRGALRGKIDALDELMRTRAENEDKGFLAVQVGVTLAACEVDAAPTVDAVEVVRCESCCFSEGIPADREDDYYSDRVLHCRLLRGNYDPDGVSAVWRNGYCDEGKRKEAHNGEVD